MKYKYLLPVVLGVVVCCMARAQHDVRILSYNVENLFDTLDCPLTADDEFLPEGSHHWNSLRYRTKLRRLCDALAAGCDEEPAMLVGLCEVENDSCVYDLCHRTMLGRLGYEYIITHSDDPRGINVALLYQPLLFVPLSHDTLRVSEYERKGQRIPLRTRDVLHVLGQETLGGTWLDVFVVHLPSRRGGTHESNPRRQAVAQALWQATDSIARQRRSEGREPRIIVMGDFNSEAKDRIFKGHRQGEDTAGLHLVTEGLRGSYRFQGLWSQLDHALLSNELYGRLLSVENVRLPFLMDNYGMPNEAPLRTFLGPVYKGGTSDHLMLRIVVRL